MIADALTSYDLAGLIVALGVATLVAARLYSGEQAFSAETRWWGPLRRVAIPIIATLVESLDPAGETGLHLTDEIDKEELVATIEVEYHAVLDDLAAAGYQPQPLAALTTDWEGRREVASWARYHGAPLFDGAPDWLRPRQTHVTLFADQATSSTGETIPLTIVTAHTESNPWRPDQWRDHYLGRSRQIGVGVVQVAEALGIDVDLEPAQPDRSERSTRARQFR